MAATDLSGMNFVLAHLNQETTLSTLATVYTQPDVPQIEADARGVIYVTESQIKGVFQIRTDAFDVIDAPETDIEYYVYKDVFDTLGANAAGINPADAMMDTAFSRDPISLNDKAANPYAPKKCSVAHDFVRHLAKDLFGSWIGVDILNNEAALLQNIRLKCGSESGNVMDLINTLVANVSTTSTATVEGLAGTSVKYMTNANETAENLCRVLFNQMITSQPARFANLAPLDEAGDPVINDQDGEPRPLPFMVGDTVNFKLIINPAEDQHAFIRGEEGTPVAPRSYEIRLQVIADDDATLENTDFSATEGESDEAAP